MSADADDTVLEAERIVRLAAIEAAPAAPEALPERISGAIYRELRRHLAPNSEAWRALGSAEDWKAAIEHAGLAAVWLLTTPTAVDSSHAGGAE